MKLSEVSDPMERAKRTVKKGPRGPESSEGSRDVLILLTIVH